MKLQLKTNNEASLLQVELKIDIFISRKEQSSTFHEFLNRCLGKVNVSCRLLKTSLLLPDERQCFDVSVINSEWSLPDLSSKKEKCLTKGWVDKNGYAKAYLCFSDILRLSISSWWPWRK